MEPLLTPEARLADIKQRLKISRLKFAVIRWAGVRRDLTKTEFTFCLGDDTFDQFCIHTLRLFRRAICDRVYASRDDATKFINLAANIEDGVLPIIIQRLSAPRLMREEYRMCAGIINLLTIYSKRCKNEVRHLYLQCLYSPEFMVCIEKMKEFNGHLLLVNLLGIIDGAGSDGRGGSDMSPHHLQSGVILVPP